MAVNKQTQSGVRREAAGGPVVQTNPISGLGLGKGVSTPQETPCGVTTNRAAAPNEANRPRAISIVPVFHHSSPMPNVRNEPNWEGATGTGGLACETKPICRWRPAMGARRPVGPAGATRPNVRNKANWPWSKGFTTEAQRSRRQSGFPGKQDFSFLLRVLRVSVVSIRAKRSQFRGIGNAGTAVSAVA